MPKGAGAFHNLHMAETREFVNARWHGRTGFLATTLFALLVLGAPLLVTRGMLEHGTLFLPITLALFVLFGGPLTRLSLATGQLDHQVQGRPAIQGVQTLLRVTAAILIGVLGARAAGWLIADLWLPLPEGTLDYQQRELTVDSTVWHTAGSQPLWVGAAAVLVLALLFWALSRRRRLAGMSWLDPWLLGLFLVLVMLAVLVGYSLPGAGAFAVLAAPVRVAALYDLSLWGDAAAVAMLAGGAQTGVLVAAGRGLPQRARIGRESRILVAGAALLLASTGMAGLLLLSAACLRLGIVPQAEHAQPGVMLLEVVPMLGAELFSSWPESLRPATSQVRLGWCFFVAICAAAGAATLLASHPLLPREPRSRSAMFGYAAVVICVLAVGASMYLGVEDAYAPLLTVMPALLAVIRLTMARRAGGGMRVVSAAFASTRPWMERWLLMLAFRIARPLLLLAVLAVALSRREYSLVLAGFALAFALMWVGSLQIRRRSAETGMLRAVAPVSAMAALCVLLPVLAAAADADRLATLVSQVLTSSDRQQRMSARRDFERELALLRLRGEHVDSAPLHDMVLAALPRESGAAEASHRARDAAACVLLADPESDSAMLLERQVLTSDGVAPFTRLDEAISEHAAGDHRSLREACTRIQAQLQGPALQAVLAGPEAPTSHYEIALVKDLRHAYGTGGLAGRELRRYLVQRAVGGRSLLRPDALPGLTWMVCFLLTAGFLALALLLGVDRKR